MIFSKETMEVGAEIVVPHSWTNKGPGRIIEVTAQRIVVKYRVDNGILPYEQTCSYSFEWLNEKYGPNRVEPPPPDDAAPFDDGVPI